MRATAWSRTICIGVSVADLKVIAKTIKGQQALACELYATGNMDAMYLAGMIADGSQMTRKTIERLGRGRGKFADDCRIYGALGDGGKPAGSRTGAAMDEIEEGARCLSWLVYVFGACRHKAG